MEEWNKLKLIKEEEKIVWGDDDDDVKDLKLVFMLVGRFCSGK